MWVTRQREAVEDIIRATFCSRFYSQTHIALQCLVHIRVTELSPKCLIQAVSGLSHPPQVVWQAPSHSSRSWKKAYPCATWQRVFLLRTRAIFSCTAYEDFLTLFPVRLPPCGLVDLIFNWLPTSNLMSVFCQALDAGSLFRLMALDPCALWMYGFIDGSHDREIQQCISTTFFCPVDYLFESNGLF